MSTLALPIDRLERSVAAAHRETRNVERYAKAHTQNLKRFWRIAQRTLRLAWRLRVTVARQAFLLRELVDGDFSTASPDSMGSLAKSISELVVAEREILDRAYALPATITFCWGSSLRRLESQSNHLDSIAESLHLAADEEATSLLAFAAQQFA